MVAIKWPSDERRYTLLRLTNSRITSKCHYTGKTTCEWMYESGWLFEWYQFGSNEQKPIEDRYDDFDSHAGETIFRRDYIYAVIYAGF